MSAGTRPVVVVGAGPVGLVAALSLSRAGIPVILLERLREPDSDLRASTFHPPTLEMLDELGLAEPLIASGLESPTWQIRLHETHERAEFDLALLGDDTRYPFRLQNEQSTLCRLGFERVRADDGIDFRTGAGVQSIDQDAAGVRVVVERDGDTEVVEGSFVIAADGARSTVRKCFSLDFDGLTYPETTILATTTFPFHDHLPGLSNVNYVWFDGGTFSLLRLPTLWRVSLYADSGESVDEATEPAAVERKLQRIVARDEPYDIGEIRPYRIHQRILTDYRVGRVLFAGDAAHLNSPSGGMGMNGGIHDAVAAVECLAPVWRGEADVATLDGYTRRRLPVARDQILKQAHANRTRMQQRDPAERRRELERLKRIAGDPIACREHLLKTSMIAGLRRAAAA